MRDGKISLQRSPDWFAPHCVVSQPFPESETDCGLYAERRISGPFARGLASQRLKDSGTRKIADDRSIAVVPPRCPIIDANHGQCGFRNGGLSPNNPEQRVVADKKHQALGEARCWPAAKREARTVPDMLQSRRSTRYDWEDVVTKSSREYPASTTRRVAKE